jgi:hypothetical protein
MHLNPREQFEIETTLLEVALIATAAHICVEVEVKLNISNTDL